MAGVQKHIDIQEQTMLYNLLEYVNGFHRRNHRGTSKECVVPQLCFDAMIQARNKFHSRPNVMTCLLEQQSSFLKDFVLLADLFMVE